MGVSLCGRSVTRLPLAGGRLPAQIRSTPFPLLDHSRLPSPDSMSAPLLPSIRAQHAVADLRLRRKMVPGTYPTPATVVRWMGATEKLVGPCSPPGRHGPERACPNKSGSSQPVEAQRSRGGLRLTTGDLSISGALPLKPRDLPLWANSMCKTGRPRRRQSAWFVPARHAAGKNHRRAASRRLSSLMLLAQGAKPRGSGGRAPRTSTGISREMVRDTRLTGVYFLTATNVKGALRPAPVSVSLAYPAGGPEAITSGVAGAEPLRSISGSPVQPCHEISDKCAHLIEGERLWTRS
jgi:hypothetical protein